MDKGKLRVNLETFNQNWESLNKEIAIAEGSLNEVAGFPVNVGSAKDLEELFCKKYGVKPLRVGVKSGRISFSKEVIEAWDTPVTRQVIDLKSMKGSLKYFAIAKKFLVEKDGYGEIEFDWSEEATTGRLYAKDPSVMSFPEQVREAIIPKPGNIFIAADYVNQELAIIAHILGDRQMIEDIRSGRDPFTVLAELTGAPRDKIKVMIYALMYGSKPEHIPEKVLMEPNQASFILGRIFAYYPSLHRWLEMAKKVDAQGYAETLFGDRYTLDQSNPDHEKEIRRGVNFIAQGTAAGILRRVLPQIPPTNLEFVVCVHDSILTETEEFDAVRGTQEVRRVMEDVLDGDLTVKIKIGYTWKEVWKGEEVVNE